MNTTILHTLQWFGHATRMPGSPAHDVMHGLGDGAKRMRKTNRTWLTDMAE